jgi:glycosyltransferase involved in cell wall biosynthesis
MLQRRKILILAHGNANLATALKSDGYNGAGWVGSALKLLSTSSQLDLGVVYLTHDIHSVSEAIVNIKFFPFYLKKPSKLQKVLKYHTNYKFTDELQFVNLQFQQYLTEFCPEVIHFFGFESYLAQLINRINLPFIVHIQGLLNPYSKVYFPPGFNQDSVRKKSLIREVILNNGFVYNYHEMVRRAKVETQLIRKTKNVCGRTNWDQAMIKSINNQVNYFHIDEVLRESFYKNQGCWQYKEFDRLVITSTISESLYKGLDLIINTALILKLNFPNIQFEWQIIGVSQDSYLVEQIKDHLKIDLNSLPIKFLGNLSEQKLCSLLLNSNLYVHPSYIENSPNSLCEAQILGLPVISTNVGGIGSIVENGVSGILVPSNAPFELACEISNLYEDKTSCVKFSDNAKRIAIKRHDKDRILQQLINTYSKLY